MKKIGVFGTCRIDNFNIHDFVQKTYQYPYIYQNSNYTINVRPLGYTITTSDVLQNLKLIKSQEYLQITDKFIFNNIFLKHRGTRMIPDLDYNVLILEICSTKKIIHKATNYIFPYEIENGKFNQQEYFIEKETFDESIANIIAIQKLLDCHVILLPPICIFDEAPQKGVHEDLGHMKKVIDYRYDIVNRLQKAEASKITFFDWNQLIEKYGTKQMLADQFHFTDFGKKLISQNLFQIIENLSLC